MQTQSQTKKDDVPRTRRETGPVRIVDPSRLSPAGSPSLTEVQFNLQRLQHDVAALSQGAPHAGPWTATTGYGGYGNAPWNLANPGFATGFPAFPAAFPTGFAANAWNAAGWNPASAGIPAQAGLANAAFGGLTQFAAPASAMAAMGPAALAYAAAAPRIPPSDIVDEGGEYVCQVELPGVKADNVELYCFERAILVNAVSEPEIDVGSLVQSERGTSVTYRRAIALPAEIQPTSCRATLRDGVLTVNLPKVAPSEGPRRIDIQR